MFASIFVIVYNSRGLFLSAAICALSAKFSVHFLLSSLALRLTFLLSCVYTPIAIRFSSVVLALSICCFCSLLRLIKSQVPVVIHSAFLRSLKPMTLSAESRMDLLIVFQLLRLPHCCRSSFRIVFFIFSLNASFISGFFSFSMAKRFLLWMFALILFLATLRRTAPMTR